MLKKGVSLKTFTNWVKLDKREVTIRMINLMTSFEKQDYHKTIFIDKPDYKIDVDKIFFLLSAVKESVGLDDEKELTQTTSEFFHLAEQIPALGFSEIRHHLRYLLKTFQIRRYSDINTGPVSCRSLGVN